MKTFTDNAARTWTVQVNVDAIKRVRDLTRVNLLDVVDGKLLEQLTSDPILLCDVIYSLAKPEADARSVSDVDFGRAMGGDAIDAATTALLEELVDFFPSARRAVLAKAMTKLKKLQATALAAVEARLDSTELDALMETQLKRLMTSSGSAPESSGSIPADSH